MGDTGEIHYSPLLRGIDRLKIEVARLEAENKRLVEQLRAPVRAVILEGDLPQQLQIRTVTGDRDGLTVYCVPLKSSTDAEPAPAEEGEGG